MFSLTRIGDLDRQLGQQREALTTYEEALALQRRLATDATHRRAAADAGVAARRRSATSSAA